MKKLALLTLLWAFCFSARATITPVSLTGYNADIVSNGAADPSTTISSYMTDGFDSAGYALVASDYSYSGSTPSYSLPASGSFSSALTGGLSFQLASYSSNNALRLLHNADTGNLSFATPQVAGALYVCGLSGSGISNFTVVVNFSDGTTQSFTSQTYPDWYASGGALAGIGRVSTTDGSTEGSGTAPSLFQVTLNIDPVNYTKTITGVHVVKTSTTGILAIMAISAEDICSGTPTAGAVAASVLTGCSAFTSNLSLPTSTAATGITYQWQSSADSTTWTNITGATNATYTASVSDTTYYRAYVTCSISSLSDTSAGVELLLTTPAAIVATLPFNESFESWTGSCFAFDRPGVSWLTSPASGNNSWRRDDQGSDASWTFTTFGSYSPVSTEGSHSARFHTYEAPSGTSGTMDLHVDLSPAGTKQISLNYINTTGSDYLKVQLSEDGGATFTDLATYNTAGSWTNEVVTTSSVAANAIVRLYAYSDYGFSDIGVDSFTIVTLTGCSGTPTAGVITASQYTSCTAYTSNLSVPLSSIGGITYQWQSSTDSTTWANVTGATNITYSASVTATVYYRVVATCTSSTLSDTAAPVHLFLVVPVATVATLPFTESFESWIGTCFTYDRPSVNWLNTPPSGNNSWRRDDEGADASWTLVTSYMYSPASTAGSHSARFHSGYTMAGIIGNLDLHVDFSAAGTKQITFDHINTSGSDHLDVELSVDSGATFTTLGTYSSASGWVTSTLTTDAVAPNAILRFSGVADYGSTDIGLDNLSISVLVTCAGTPSADSVTASQYTSCSAFTSTLSLPLTSIGGLTYQWQSSTDSAAWTNITGATNYNYTASVSANTYYRVAVTCTTSALSDTSAGTLLQIVVPAATIATVPYFEGFESWIGTCFISDRPSNNWLNSPSSGNNSWRRDDQGADASWGSLPYYGYSPASTEGSHSARFHSGFAYSGLQGNLDLHINLSTPGTKLINFDYINEDGSDVLNVQLSTDSGATFTTLGSFSPNGGWTSEQVSTASVAADAIIRLNAVSDYGSSDIGVDSFSVSLAPSCTGTPTAGTFTASTTSACTAYTSTLSVDAPISLSGISYQWQSSTDGVAFTNVSGATDFTYTASVSANTYYRFYVACATSGFGDTSAATELTYAPVIPGYATVPYFQGFENWIGGCYSSDRPDTSWVNSPATGNNSWRRDDQGSDASWTSTGGGSYAPASVEGSHSARFHSYYADAGTIGNMDLYINLSTPGTKQIAFAYNNSDDDFGSDELDVQISTDSGATFTTLASYFEIPTGWQDEVVTTTSVAPHAIIRFTATSDFGTTDIGIDSLSITVTPACAAPVAVTASSITDTSATIAWDSIASVAGYQYVVNTTSADPTAAGTATTDTSVHVGSLAGSTTYYVHVRTACSSTSTSAWTTILFTTLATPPAVCDSPVLDVISAITSTSATATWSTITGAAGYRYAISTSATAPTGGTYTTTATAAFTGLTPATTYYVYVRTECDAADSSAWVSTSFTTLAPAGCDSPTTLSITGVTETSATATWTAVPGAAGYRYVISPTATTPTGGTYTTATTASFTGLIAGTTYFVYVRTECDASDSSGWIVTPFTTLPTTTPTGCDTPTSVTVSAVTSTTATATWTAVTGAAGYQYGITTTSATPIGAGTVTTSTTANFTSLTPSTTYYVFVRTECSSGDSSAWIMTSFTTLATPPPPCDATTGLTASAIADSSATLSWTASAGVNGYEYVVNTTAGDPTTAGTATTATSVNVTNIDCNTTYYLHVRTDCTDTTVSSWSTITFTTLPCPNVGVNTVNAIDFGVQAYPNPVTSMVKVEVTGQVSGTASVQLTDVTGKTVQIIRLTGNTAELDMTNLASGIYFINYSDNENKRTLKVNKQ